MVINEINLVYDTERAILAELANLLQAKKKKKERKKIEASYFENMIVMSH